MTKGKTGIRRTLQREIMIKELVALEKRFDARMDFQMQSFKEYVDSRLGPIQSEMKGMRGDITQMQGEMKGMRGDITQMQGEMKGMRSDMNQMQGEMKVMRGDIQEMRGDMQGIRGEIKGLGDKMDRYFGGMVKMVENLTGKVSDHDEQLKDYAGCLKVLESNA
ncbi:MAG: hypothetical protein HY277_00200 [Ignavibacteriales bacterium]|nr:hypothetical protein [Ignavibacteriales bacterium]